MKGFIALLTVIITSAVLLALVATASLTAYFSRSSSLGVEEHMRAQSLAESCEQIALLDLAQNNSYNPTFDPAYVVGEGVPKKVDTETCYIKDISQLSSTATSTLVQLDVWAQSGQSFSSLTATMQLSSNAAPQLISTFEQ
jgi:hypothetical protein